MPTLHATSDTLLSLSDRTEEQADRLAALLTSMIGDDIPTMLGKFINIERAGWLERQAFLRQHAYASADRRDLNNTFTWALISARTLHDSYQRGTADDSQWACTAQALDAFARCLATFLPSEQPVTVAA